MIVREATKLYDMWGNWIGVYQVQELTMEELKQLYPETYARKEDFDRRYAAENPNEENRDVR